MTIYVYQDTAGHKTEVNLRMSAADDAPPVICRKCGAVMRRVPQAPRVNYNGDTSSHPLHPAIKQLINDAPRRRDQYAKEHEEHERRTANEAN